MKWYFRDEFSNTKRRRKEGICYIHAYWTRFTSLSILMLIFKRKIKRTRKRFIYLSSFLCRQLVSCKQFIYFWDVSEFWGDFLVVYLKFAVRILIAHRELRVHITLEQPRLFLHRGSLIYTSMSTYHLLLIKSYLSFLWKIKRTIYSDAVHWEWNQQAIVVATWHHNG